MATGAAIFDEADLNAFADGRLEPARAAALAESLASDRVARSRVDGWKRQNDGLRTLFASVLFEPVPVRLLPTTLGADPAGRAADAPIDARPGTGRSRNGAFAVVAVALALAGFAAGVLATTATDGFGRLAAAPHDADARPTSDALTLERRAAEAYRAALADPVRSTDFAAADEARLQHWMVRQIAGAARIPDLRPQGWKLVGGTVVSGQYAPAAFLLYARGTERVGLYVARDPVATPPRLASLADVRVEAWSHDGFGAALASTEEIRDAVGSGEAMRDAVRRQLGGDGSTP